MANRIKIVLLITIGFCCFFSFIYFQNQLVLSQPSLNDVNILNDTVLCCHQCKEAVNNGNNTTPQTNVTANISKSINVMLVNKSFSEHKLWYEEKLLMKTEELPLSKYDIKTTKRILLWSETWTGLPNPLCDDRKDWFRLNGCPVWQCQVTPWDSQGKNLNESGINVEHFDAIVFHDPFWAGIDQIPVKRSPNQRYIYWNIEAPGSSTFMTKWAEASDFFNWTMTYRWDSDIVVPYGYTRFLTGAEIRSRKEDFNKRNYAEGKSKLVIWIASNCFAWNGRNEYVDRLQNYIPVDIYGKCGNLTCAHGKQKECREMMSRDYKFVIAFENSLCFDYVTEKMFYNANFDVVPIVMDLHGNYNRFVPPKSYINALDFPSVKELADYLKMLDKNDTLYNEYFRWKESYAMEYSLQHNELNIYEASARGYCGLCSKLHNPSEPVSVVKNLKKWWSDDATCRVIAFPDSSGADSGHLNDTWMKGIIKTTLP